MGEVSCLRGCEAAGWLRGLGPPPVVAGRMAAVLFLLGVVLLLALSSSDCGDVRAAGERGAER